MPYESTEDRREKLTRQKIEAKARMQPIWQRMCEIRQELRTLQSEWSSYNNIFERADRMLAEEKVKVVKKYNKKKDPLAGLSPEQLQRLIKELEEKGGEGDV
jgi:hypothetical protein